MNLDKLFEMQRSLDERIVIEKELQGKDLLLKKISALRVEVAECENESRHFKFWSHDREPRTVTANVIREKGYLTPNWNNPLLEEYVDCLHFILSIGIELNMENKLIIGNAQPNSTLMMFSELYSEISFLQSTVINKANDLSKQIAYLSVVDHFITLGEILGFTWEQVEQAYYEKNAVNHQRQEEGY